MDELNQEYPVKAVIFDFDGTIADTLPLSINIAIKINDELKLIRKEEIDLEAFRSISTEDFIKRLKLPEYKIIYYLLRIRSILGKNIDKVEVFSGIKDVLFQLKKYNIKLAIVSTNSVKNIKKFIKINNIELFDFIASPLFPINKRRAIGRVINNLGISPKNIIYVGDETRDIKAAHDNNLRAVSVTWGFHFRNLLIRYNPDYVVDNTNDLLKLILSLGSKDITPVIR